MKAFLEAANGTEVSLDDIYAYKLKLIDGLLFVQVLVMTPTDYTGHGEWVLLRGHYDSFYDCSQFTQSLGVPLR